MSVEEMSQSGESSSWLTDPDDSGAYSASKVASNPVARFRCGRDLNPHAGIGIVVVHEIGEVVPAVVVMKNTDVELPIKADHRSVA